MLGLEYWFEQLEKDFPDYDDVLKVWARVYPHTSKKQLLEIIKGVFTDPNFVSMHRICDEKCKQCPKYAQRPQCYDNDCPREDEMEPL